MATIKVKYRPSRAEGGEGTIYYQIVHERKVRQIGTNYHIFAGEWDESRSRVTAGPGGDRQQLVLHIRERIRRDVERLTRIERKLEAERMSYTPDDVIEEFRRFENECTLFRFMEKLIAKFRKNGKIRTSETYTAAMRSFRKFLREPDMQGQPPADEDPRLDCLTPELMEAYAAWHKAKGNTPNTISFYTRILRAVYNRAVEKGGIDDLKPFGRVYTGVDKTMKRALPLDTVSKIKRLDLSAEPAMEYARDMFMMSFYLRGMSFIDMAYLRKTDLRNGYVVYRRRKTGQQLTIAWTAEMQTLVDKYPANPTPYLLPIIRTPGCNERCAYRNAGYNINRSLKKISGMVGVAIPITMYVARHSWATAAKAKGVPLSVISEGMGHDSEATTRIYLASLETSVVDKANDLILSSL